MAFRSFALGSYDEATRTVPVIASTRNPVQGWEPAKDGMGPGRPRLEALESWNLERYAKNPVILWQHDTWSGAIGFGRDVRETPRGLEMTIEFAAANVQPRAEEAIKQVRAGLLRGVSVGFTYGDRTDEQRDGKPVVVFRRNVLNEVSLVTIPADENALIDQAAPAGVLGTRSDATDTDSVRRFDFGTIGTVRRSPVGGIVAPARLTRTGVLEYRLPDGRVRRELRLPEEVFHADSLASLRDVPVTDLAHHRAFIDPSNFKEATLGHATDIRADGKFVTGDLHINDARAVVDVEARRLSDVSCGYQCKLEQKSGEYEGERYDCIQRRIRYNHVAVLPPGRGRAGTDVGIRLDSNDAVAIDGGEPNTMNEKTKTVIRLDGKEFEFGSEEHVRHLDSKCQAALDAKAAAETKAKADLDALQARFDAAAAKSKKDMDDAAECAAKEKKESGARARRRARLLMRAADYVEGDDDEKKMDALEELSDRDLMVKVIRSDANHKEFDDKGKSDEYVQAFFDAIPSGGRRADGVDSVVAGIERAKRSDAKELEQDPEAKAAKAAEERANGAWKRGTEAPAK